MSFLRPSQQKRADVLRHTAERSRFPGCSLEGAPRLQPERVAYLMLLKAFSRATCASVPRKVATEKKSRPTQSSCALAMRVSMSQSIPMPAQAPRHARWMSLRMHLHRVLTVHVHCVVYWMSMSRSVLVRV